MTLQSQSPTDIVVRLRELAEHAQRGWAVDAHTLIEAAAEIERFHRAIMQLASNAADEIMKQQRLARNEVECLSKLLHAARFQALFSYAQAYSSWPLRDQA
jgi:hypothetical protein